MWATHRRWRTQAMSWKRSACSAAHQSSLRSAINKHASKTYFQGKMDHLTAAKPFNNCLKFLCSISAAGARVRRHARKQCRTSNEL